MRTKDGWLLFLFLFISIPLSATDGLWLPLLLARLSDAQRQELGLEISGKDIYSPNSGSLTDAVVQIGGNCSGTVISRKGLILTRSTCTPAPVDGAGSNEPFWALRRQEEVPIPGLSVTFTIRMEEVTEAVLEGITPDLPEKLQRATIDRNIREIERAVPRPPHQNTRVRSFYKGNRYYLFITETYRDVRLVGRSPELFGKYQGGSPPLPGFSLFRIYADADNRPAGFSEDNIPYQPRHFLPITLSGPETGAASLTMGFPLHSEWQLPAAGLQLRTEVLYPAKSEMLNRIFSLLNLAIREGKPGSRYATISQVVLDELQTITGTLDGLLASDAVAEKLTREGEFHRRLDTNEVWRMRYDKILTQLGAKYVALRPYTLARTYLEEIAYRRVELFRLLHTLHQFIGLYEHYGAAPLQKRKAQLLQFVKDYYEGYRPEVDQSIMAGMLALYYKKMNVDLISPYVVEQVHQAEKDFEQLASFIFQKTALAQPEPLLALLEGDLTEALTFVREDAAYTFFRQMVDTHEEKVLPTCETINKEIEQLLRLYLEAQLVLFPNLRLTPDANGTLRISTGSLQATPTFLEDILSENIPENSTSSVPIMEAFQNKNYGRYGKDGKLQVFFTDNAPTMTGFEGGPVLNAAGRLLGIHWGRPPESAMSNLFYDPDICRSITLDIRYVLFVMEEHAAYLTEEMKN
jgi:hypothetical protein